MKIFYANNRISDFVDRLDNDSLRILAKTFYMLRIRGHDLRMPYSKSIGNGLFELRPNSKPPIRAVFGFHNGNALIVNIFFKKTMRIPKHEIDYVIYVWKSIVA